MKKISEKKLKFILIVLIGLLILTLITTVLVTSSDRRFKSSASRGLQESWAREDNELQLLSTVSDSEADFIKTEYKAVKGYASASFKDKELGYLAGEYISALQACIKAELQYNPEDDYNEYWTEFAACYGDRLKALYKLIKGGYISLPDDKYLDEKKYVMVNGWLMDKMPDITFNNVEVKKGKEKCVAIVSNGSGYAITDLTLDVEVLDETGHVLGIVTVYQDEWAAGEEIELSFKHNQEDASSYRIVSETCEVK